MPDLIVFDPALPDKDGLEVLKDIKSHMVLREVPIVFLLEGEDRQKWSASTPSPLDILVKPLNLDELTLKIRNWIAFLENQGALKKKAMTDALTGLKNEVALGNELFIRCYHAEKFKKDFSVLSLDIDYFTKYNDIYGHRFGDSLLQILSVFWQNALCPSDVMFRYKGPSFTVILKDTNSQEGIKIAERLRRITYERGLPHQAGIDNLVTISIGVTAFKRRDTAGTILHRAASYLAEAKKAGRNIVKFGI